MRNSLIIVLLILLLASPLINASPPNIHKGVKNWPDDRCFSATPTPGTSPLQTMNVWTSTNPSRFEINPNVQCGTHLAVVDGPTEVVYTGSGTQVWASYGSQFSCAGGDWLGLRYRILREGAFLDDSYLANYVYQSTSGGPPQNCAGTMQDYNAFVNGSDDRRFGHRTNNYARSGYNLANHPVQGLRINSGGAALDVDNYRLLLTPYLDARTNNFAATSGQAISIQGTWEGGGTCTLIDADTNATFASMSQSGITYNATKSHTITDANAFKEFNVIMRCNDSGFPTDANESEGFIYQFKWFRDNLIEDGGFETCNTTTETCGNWTVARNANVPDSRYGGFAENYDTNAYTFESIGNQPAGYGTLNCPQGQKCANMNSANLTSSLTTLTTIENYGQGELTWEEYSDQAQPTSSQLNAKVYQGATLLAPTCTLLGLDHYICNVALAPTEAPIQFRHLDAGGGAGDWFLVDNVRWSLSATDLVVNTDPDELGEDTPFQVIATYTDSVLETPVLSADCNITFDSLTKIPTYDSGLGAYVSTFTPTSQGNKDLTTECQTTTHQKQTDYQTLTIYGEEFLGRYDALVITDIENVSHTQNDENITFTPTDDELKIIYDINNPIYNFDLEVRQTILNGNNDSTKEYYIYSGIESDETDSQHIFDEDEEWDYGDHNQTFAVSNILALDPTITLDAQFYDENFNDNNFNNGTNDGETMVVENQRIRAIATVSAGTPATPAGTDYDINHYELFEDNNITRIDEDWTFENIAEYIVSGGALRKDNVATKPSYVIYDHYQDVNVKVDAIIRASDVLTEEAGIIFQYVSPTNFYACTYNWEDNILKIVDDADTVFSSTSLVLAHDTNHDVNVEVIGDTVDCSFGGTEISYNGLTPTSGKVGFHSWDNSGGLNEEKIYNSIYIYNATYDPGTPGTPGSTGDPNAIGLYYHNVDKTNATIKVDLNFSNTNLEGAGIAQQIQDENNFLVCSYNINDALINIAKVESGVITVLNVGTTSIAPDAFYEMQFSVINNGASCTFNGETVLATGFTPAAGKYGVVFKDTTVNGVREFDNLEGFESTVSFPTSGTWTSNFLDIGNQREITFFSIDETLSGSQDTTWQIRRGNSLSIDATWTSWQALTKNAAVSITDEGRYAQLKGTLIADVNTTPQVNTITLTHEYATIAQEYGLITNLTYGFNGSNGIQRTWNNTLDKYEFTFQELFPVGFTRTYTIAWKEPMKAWPNLNTPDILSTNTIQNSYVEGRQIQTFNLSQYTNLDLRWADDLPALLSTPEQEDRYILRFTAFLDNNQSDLNIYIQDQDNLQTIAITDQPHTYHINVEGSIEIYTQLTPADPARSLYWEKTSIDERGGFETPIILLDQFNQPLQIAISSTEGIYFPYVDEGQAFKAQSTIYDTHNRYDYYEVRTYIGTPTIEDRVYNKRTCLIEECDNENFEPSYADPITYTIDETLSGVVDTTPPSAYDTTTPDRLIKITIAVHDRIDNEFEIISDDVIMYQFPHLPSHLILGAREYETQVGKNPYGEVILNILNNEIVNAVHLTLEPLSFTPAEDQNYEKIFIKDEYFECIFEDCGFDYFLEDYKFPQAGRYLLTATLDHKTEIYNTDNPYTNYRLIIDTNKIGLNLARLISPFERQSGIFGFPLRQAFQYKNTEPIHLVLELRDEKNADLGDNYRPRLQLRDCGQINGTIGSCNGTDSEATRESVFFLPEGEHFYDEQTGINRWFFKHILYEDETVFLQNGHEYSIFATIADLKEQHEDIGEIGLTKKNPLTPGAIFWSLVNGTDEYYINIDNAITFYAPDFRCMACTELDIEEGYETAFEAPIECIGLYGIRQQAPDQFEFKIGNQNSDYLEENPNLQQFIQVNIDWIDMVKRDRNFMFDLLETDYGTIDYIWQYFKAFGQQTFGNQFFDDVSGANDLEQFFSAKGYDPTTNQVCDYNQALNTLPQNIDIFAFKLTDLEVINAQDYTALEGVNPKQLLKRASQLEINLPITENRIDFYATSGSPEKTFTRENRLVIDEAYSTTTTDVNAEPDSRIINLTLIGDLLYNNSYLTDTIIVNMQYYTILESNKPIVDSVFEWFGELWDNPGKATKALLAFIISNLLWLLIIFFVVVMAVYINVGFRRPREG